MHRSVLVITRRGVAWSGARVCMCVSAEQTGLLSTARGKGAVPPDAAYTHTHKVCLKHDIMC